MDEAKVEYVAVPKYLLEQLERDRVKLYETYIPTIDKNNVRTADVLAVMKLQNMTETMWELAHTRWKVVKVIGG